MAARRQAAALALLVVGLPLALLAAGIRSGATGVLSPLGGSIVLALGLVSGIVAARWHAVWVGALAGTAGLAVALALAGSFEVQDGLFVAGLVALFAMLSVSLAGGVALSRLRRREPSREREKARSV